MNPVRTRAGKTKAEIAPASITGKISNGMKSMALKPRQSEKTYTLSQSENTYVFDVPITANKFEVADAVSVQFSVTVENVRMTIIKGKAIRTIRKGGRAAMGKRVDVKKAYVRLKAGDNIPVFAAIEKAEEDQKKIEDKVAKKAAKVKK